MNEWCPPENINVEELKPFTQRKLQISIPDHTRATQREAFIVKFNYQTSFSCSLEDQLISPLFCMWSLFIKLQLWVFQKQSPFYLSGKYNEQETDSDFCYGKGVPEPRSSPHTGKKVPQSPSLSTPWPPRWVRELWKSSTIPSSGSEDFLRAKCWRGPKQRLGGYSAHPEVGDKGWWHSWHRGVL